MTRSGRQDMPSRVGLRRRLGISAATLDQSQTAEIDFGSPLQGPQFTGGGEDPRPLSNAQTFTAGLSGSLAQVDSFLPPGWTIRRRWSSRSGTRSPGPPAQPVTHDCAAEYAFDGFFAPIDAGAFNVLKAGQAVPATFSLGGDQGLGVVAAGSPTSRPVSCDASVPADPVEETAAAGASGLSYDAATGTYAYAWKTAKAWAGTCRELTVTLLDGTSHTALFRLTR